MRRIRIVLAAVAALVVSTSGARAVDETFLLTTSQRDTASFAQLVLEYVSILTIKNALFGRYGAIRGDFSVQGYKFGSPQGSRAPFGKGGGGSFRTGLSAGGSARNVAAWGSYSYANFSDSHPTTKMNGDTNSFFLGIDGEVYRNLIAGMSMGVGLTDTTGTVNGGKSNSTGVTLAPYLLYIFNKNFDIDLFFGGTFTENDNERMVGGTVVTSDSDSWTTFISAHANYTRWMGRWKFTGNSGVTFSETKGDSYGDSLLIPVPSLTTKIGTFEIGGRVLYYWKSVQPYVEGRFEYDFKRTKVKVGAGQAAPPNDRTGFVLGGGVNFTLARNITAGVTGNVVLGRQNFSTYTIGANVRWAFGGVK